MNVWFCFLKLDTEAHVMCVTHFFYAYESSILKYEITKKNIQWFSGKKVVCVAGLRVIDSLNVNNLKPHFWRKLMEV